MNTEALIPYVVDHRDDPVDNPDKERGLKAIPQDIHKSGYRLRAYVYSNIEKKDLNLVEKTYLIEMSQKLIDEQIIYWTRSQLYELDPDKIMALYKFMHDCVNITTDVDVLRVALYILRMLKRRDFFIDEYTIEKIPQLKYYIVNQKESYAPAKNDSEKRTTGIQVRPKV